MTQNDPVLRYMAGAIIFLAFLGTMAIVVHGYWTDSNYQLSPLLAGVLGPLLGFAATILGVHLGSSTATSAGEQAITATQLSIKQGANGSAHDSAPGGS